jgi:hypothetical protein
MAGPTDHFDSQTLFNLFGPLATIRYPGALTYGAPSVRMRRLRILITVEPNRFA